MTAAATKASGEFTITLDGVDYPVVFEEGQTPPWKVTVNARSFTVMTEADGKVLVDGIVRDVTLDGDGVRAGDAYHDLAVSGLSVGPASSGLSPAPAVRTESVQGAGAITAIMPGQITRVLVEPGDDVKEGDAVCVLEAMKMENELRADRDGVVSAVHVEPGEDVEKGRVLVEIQ